MSYERQIATAQRLIKKSGALVTWRKQVVVKNVDQPWKAAEATPEDHQVYIVFGSQGDSLAQAIVHLIKGTDAPSGAPKGLLAGGLDFKPEITDQVIRDGSVMVIGSIDPVCPGDTPILYKIRFA